VTTALETSPEKLTLEFVKGRLVNGEVKRKNGEEEKHQSSGKVGSTAFASGGPTYNKAAPKQNFKFRCYNCSKIDHKRSECRLLQQNMRTKAVNTVNVGSSDSEGSLAFLSKVVKIVAVMMKKALSGLWIQERLPFNFVDRHLSSKIILGNPKKISVAKTGETLEAARIGNIDTISNVNGK
jgi:hypothetical protein